MRSSTLAGAFLAVSAAFVWATYYVFVAYGRSIDAAALFFYPSLFGSLFFIAHGALNGRSFPLPSKRRDYLLPAAGYISSQLLIIYSILLNGGVVTSIFILVGDTILSPTIIFASGRNRFRPRLPLLAGGVAVLVSSAAVLTILGGRITSTSDEGILLLILIPPALSLFFVYTNERIMADGMSRILGPTFLVSAAFTALYAVAAGTPAILYPHSPQDLLLLLVIGLTSMYAGYLLFFRASRSAGFTLTSILMALIPPFTLVLEVIFLGFEATPLAALLIALAAFGAVLCTLAYSEEPLMRGGSAK